MNKFVSAFMIILLLLSCSFASSNDSPDKLIYICEDIPPSNYLENGRLTGISVEILKMIWSKMGCPEQEIYVMPWARGYNEALSNDRAVLFSMTRTKAREDLFKWVGPLFTVKSVLLGRASDKIRIQTPEDAKNYRIGTIKNDVVELYLLNKGFKRQNIESVAGLDQNFHKLDQGRIQLIAHSDVTFREYIREHHLNEKNYVILLVLENSRNYFAFNRNIPDELVDKFQKILTENRKKHALILDKYGSDF